MFVCDGEISQKALALYGKNIHWLNDRLNGEKISDVLYAGVDENGKFYYQKRKKQ